MGKRRTTQRVLKFKQNWSVGSNAAEHEDKDLLERAFVDTGVLELLRDTRGPKCVVVGRTGVGKTALLLQLERSSERVLRIRPDQLSMKYLVGSTILPRLRALEVDLGPFYQLLWRHVLTSEVLRHYFRLHGGGPFDAPGRWTRLLRLFDRRKREALEYFRQWSPSFWADTDVRLREITQKLTDDIQAKLGADRFAALTGESRLEDTVREEIVPRVQQVIDATSLQYIQRGMEILERDVLPNCVQPYFVVVDDLDQDWIDSETAYELIDALLQVLGDFVRLANIKVVAALRENVLVWLHADRPRGWQQREKQRDLLLPLAWSKPQLEDMLERRVRASVTTEHDGTIHLATILPPPRADGVAALDYLVARTLNRPRDLISFTNDILKKAASELRHGKGLLSWEIIELAEREHSKHFVQALEDEWRANYVDLRAVLEVLRGGPHRFTTASLARAKSAALVQEGKAALARGLGSATSLCALAAEVYERSHDHTLVWCAVLPVLYQIGALGVCRAPGDAPVYGCDPDAYDPRVVAGFSMQAEWIVHPALRSALGTV